MKKTGRAIMLIIVILCLNCKNKVQLPQKEIDNDSLNGILVCDKTHISLGKLKKGFQIQEEFLFINEGNGSVNITNVESSCGCTNVHVPKKNIKAKDSTLIKMEIDTGYKDKGKHSENVVLTTDGQRETYILLVKFEID